MTEHNMLGKKGVDPTLLHPNMERGREVMLQLRGNLARFGEPTIEVIKQRLDAPAFARLRQIELLVFPVNEENASQKYSDLFAKMEEVYGENSPYANHHKLRSSLQYWINKGAMREIPVGRHNMPVVSLTDLGRSLQDLAAAYLEFEHLQNIDLDSIFGRTDAQVTRAAMMFVMLKQSSRKEMFNALGINLDATFKPLEALRKAGVAARDVSTRKSNIYIPSDSFYIGMERLDKNSLDYFISQAIAVLIKNGSEITNKNLLLVLPNFLPSHLKLRDQYSDNLVALAEKEHMLVRAEEPFATLSPLGLDIVSDLIFPLIYPEAYQPLLTDWHTEVLPRVHANLSEYVVSDLVTKSSEKIATERRITQPEETKIPVLDEYEARRRDISYIARTGGYFIVVFNGKFKDRMFRRVESVQVGMQSVNQLFENIKGQIPSDTLFTVPHPTIPDRIYFCISPAFVITKSETGIQMNASLQAQKDLLAIVYMSLNQAYLSRERRFGRPHEFGLPKGVAEELLLHLDEYEIEKIPTGKQPETEFSLKAVANESTLPLRREKLTSSLFGKTARFLTHGGVIIYDHSQDKMSIIPYEQDPESQYQQLKKNDQSIAKSATDSSYPVPIRISSSGTLHFITILEGSNLLEYYLIEHLNERKKKKELFNNWYRMLFVLRKIINHKGFVLTKFDSTHGNYVNDDAMVAKLKEEVKNASWSEIQITLKDRRNTETKPDLTMETLEGEQIVDIDYTQEDLNELGNITN